jgi:3-oxoadipate enol-lactonase
VSVAAVGEIELDYERSGSGPPLLMIMGRSGTYSHWGEPLLERLRREHELILYDHRGVGASSRLSGRLSIAQLAEDAAGLLSALEVDSAHVFGISMGGMVAQELALAHPELVRALALGCTYCGGPGSALSSPELVQRLAEAYTSGDRERAIRAAWEANVSPSCAADETLWERFHDISLRRRVAREVIAAQAHAIVGHDTHARLGGISQPTLVLHGTADEILPALNGEMIAGLVDGARLELFEGVGHLFFWERPEDSAELLLAHLGAHA